MATGDMKARLLLDSKDFEKNIKKSKKSADDFAKGASSMGDTVAGALGKMVAAAASLNTAKKFFDDFIASSQQNTDAFGRATMQATALWNNFVDSMTDSKGVGEAFDGILDRAKELYDALDALANIRISTAFTTTLESSEIKRLLTTAKDKTKTEEERRAALAEARKRGLEIEEAGMVNRQAAEEAVKRKLSLESGIPAGMITPQMIEKFLKIDARLSGPKERAAIEQAKKAFDEKIKEIELRYSDKGSGLFGTLVDNSETRRELKENTIARYSDRLLQYTALFKLTDEELKELADTYLTYTQALDKSQEQLQQFNEIERTINSDVEAARKAEVAAINKAAEEKKKAAEEESDYRRLTRGFDVGAMAGVSLSNEVSPFDKVVRKRREYIDYTKNPAGVLPGSVAMLEENPAQGALDYMDSEFLKTINEKVEGIKDLNDSLELLGGSFARLGDSIGGAAGTMLGFAGSAIEAVQAIIPLISYIQAESVAHSNNASAAAKEAAAKTLSAYAGIPFAGLSLGLAAVTAIMTALQSIPKFAEGGIVTSATLGVFGEAGPEAVLPLDKLKDYIGGNEVRVTGNIKASGKELVVVLDNYNKVRSVR